MKPSQISKQKDTKYTPVGKQFHHINILRTRLCAVYLYGLYNIAFYTLTLSVFTFLVYLYFVNLGSTDYVLLISRLSWVFTLATRCRFINRNIFMT